MQTCVLAEQVAACDGLAEGSTCVFSLPTGAIGGYCNQGGVCIPASCGNGVIDPGEACDDGNRESGDGCRGDCEKIEVCGDGVVDVGEQCDDGNTIPTDGCNNCMLT
jgi:cysteine-rich repeat protein